MPLFRQHTQHLSDQQSHPLTQPTSHPDLHLILRTKPLPYKPHPANLCLFEL